MVYITYLLIRTCLEGNKDCLILTAGVIIGLLLGIHDLSIHAGILSPSNPHLLCFGMPIILSGAAFSMSNQFARVYNQYESLNTDLENRVKERTHQLQKAHAKIIRIERESILQKERRRFSKEIHDSLGSLLISTYISIKRTILMIEERYSVNKIKDRIMRLRDNVFLALSEIESIIWSLDPVERSVEAFSIWVKDYCNDICHDKEIQVSYTPPANNSLILSTRIQEVISRIIYIAMSNIIRHSIAKEVRVSLVVEESAIRLSIEDDGIGFDPKEVRYGHGLKNMKERIEELRGRLRIYSRPERERGTKIEVKIPI